MNISFWTFSDAVMAALASRSHEWSAWEIRESEEFSSRVSGEGRSTPEFLPALEKKSLSVSLSTPGLREGRMGHAVLKADPDRDSPSDFVTRLVREAAAKDVAAFDFSSQEPARSRPEASLLERGPDKLRETVAQLETDLAERGPWSLEFVVRRFRVKNTSGLWSAFAETETSLRLGSKVAYNGERMDVSAIRKSLLGLLILIVASSAHALEQSCICKRLVPGERSGEMRERIEKLFTSSDPERLDRCKNTSRQQDRAFEIKSFHYDCRLQALEDDTANEIEWTFPVDPPRQEPSTGNSTKPLPRKPSKRP